jgi:hypothetical protein
MKHIRKITNYPVSPPLSQGIASMTTRRQVGELRVAYDRVTRAEDQLPLQDEHTAPKRLASLRPYPSPSTPSG